MLNTAETKKIIKEANKRSGKDFIEALDAHIRLVLAGAIKIDLGKRKTLGAEDVATAVENLKK
jgi:histone H3/H4